MTVGVSDLDGDGKEEIIFPSSKIGMKMKVSMSGMELKAAIIMEQMFHLLIQSRLKFAALQILMTTELIMKGLPLKI